MYKFFFIDDNYQDYLTYSSLLLSFGKVDYFYSCEDFLKNGSAHEYLFGLIDYNMPEKNGLEVAKTLKAMTEVPFCILTSEGDQQVRETALLIGAIDYIVKSTPMREIELRIKNILQFVIKHQSILYCDELKIDRRTQKANLKSVDINLTRTEFNILNNLISNDTQFLQGDQLLRSIWGETFITAQTINTHLKNLRKKTAGWKYEIGYQRGQGYKLKLGDNEAYPFQKCL